MSANTPPSDVPEARLISRDALREAEQLSGAQVTVVESQSLPTFSTIRFAGDARPAHVIEYRSDYAWAVDYLIVYHCEMLRRRVNAASSGPVDLGPSPTGLKAITGALSKAMAAKMGPAAARQFATQLLEGVIVHLRSIPLALAIDSDIETEFEALRETQRRVLAQQLRENEQALDAAGAASCRKASSMPPARSVPRWRSSGRSDGASPAWPRHTSTAATRRRAPSSSRSGARTSRMAVATTS